MLTRTLLVAAVAATRLAELAYSRRNIAAAGETIEGGWSRRTYPLIVLLHTSVLVTTAVAGRREVRRAPLAALLASQFLRIWVLLTLGRRWNTRAAVPVSMDIATGGPYAYVRHPNYTIVGIELSMLPLSFGLPQIAAAATVANALLLAPRIAEEEAALMRFDRYREHFADKPRFIPGLL